MSSKLWKNVCEKHAHPSSDLSSVVNYRRAPTRKSRTSWANQGTLLHDPSRSRWIFRRSSAYVPVAFRAAFIFCNREEMRMLIIIFFWYDSDQRSTSREYKKLKAKDANPTTYHGNPLHYIHFARMHVRTYNSCPAVGHKRAKRSCNDEFKTAHVQRSSSSPLKRSKIMTYH